MPVCLLTARTIERRATSTGQVCPVTVSHPKSLDDKPAKVTLRDSNHLDLASPTLQRIPRVVAPELKPIELLCEVRHV